MCQAGILQHPVPCNLPCTPPCRADRPFFLTCWHSWGLDSQMMGDRVIAWTDGKGVAQVAGFTIESYLEEDVNAAQGTYKIQDAAAEAATGACVRVGTGCRPVESGV